MPTGLVLTMLVVTLLGGALAIAAASPAELPRRPVAALLGVVLLGAIALAPTVTALAVSVATAAVVQAALSRETPVRVRLQRQVFGAVLLAVGALLLRPPVQTMPARAGAVALAVGLLLSLGLVPYLQRTELDEHPALRATVWPGLAGPLVFTVLMTRLVRQLPADSAAIFATLLLSFGILNLVFGVVAAWRARDDLSTWHYSFVADWGLVLVGAGVLLPLGFSGAYLLLVAVLLCRFPIFTASTLTVRDPDARSTQPRTGLALVTTAALAGAAPFVGFAARLDVLEAVDSLSWVLVGVLGICMLLWLLHAAPLARAVNLATRRQRGVAVASLLAVLIIGLYPSPLLAVAGLH